MNRHLIPPAIKSSAPHFNNILFSFWGEDADRRKEAFKHGDIVTTEGKLRVKPYTSKNGDKKISLVIYDVTVFSKPVKNHTNVPNYDLVVEPDYGCDEPVDLGLPF